MVRVAVHTNGALKNQTDFGDALQQGFLRHGLDTRQVFTPYDSAPADIRVTQGPHFAMRRWLSHPRHLHLDRAFYGPDSRYTVTLGWLQPDGSREFRVRDVTGPKGPPPQRRPRKEAGRSVCVFADYDTAPEVLRGTVAALRQVYDGVYYRSHPARPLTAAAIELCCPLEGVWALCDTAIGWRSTVLVEASLQGLDTHSCWPGHPVRWQEHDNYLDRLSWTQWSLAEVAAGDFWEHLKSDNA